MYSTHGRAGVGCRAAPMAHQVPVRGSRSLFFFFFSIDQTIKGCLLQRGNMAQTRPSSPQPRARTMATTARIDGVKLSQAGGRCQTGQQEKGQRRLSSRFPVAASHCAGEAVLSRPPCSACTPQHGLETRRPGHDSAGGSRADHLAVRFVDVLDRRTRDADGVAW
jgi:hypothetical protein